MKQTLFTICVLLILSSLNAQNKVEVPFAKESLDKADKNLEIRRISAQLDGAFLLDRRAQIAPLLEELKKLAPESAVYFYFKGLEAYSQNRKLVALGLMRQAIATDTNFSPAQNMTGLLLMDAGRAADALAFFVIAVQRSPHDPIYLYNLALCQIALDQKEKALVHLTRALEAKANFAEAAFWKGNLLLRSGQIQAAYNSLSSSIEFGITDPRAYVDFFKVAEDLDKEVRLLEVLDLLLEARDAPRLRVAADMSTRYAEWDRADAFFVRLLSLPDAAKEDRRKYMEMLYAANRNPAIWVRNVRIEESERNELLGYLRELSSKGPAFPARDPVARPGR